MREFFNFLYNCIANKRFPDQKLHFSIAFVTFNTSSRMTQLKFKTAKFVAMERIAFNFFSKKTPGKHCFRKLLEKN